MNESGLFRVGDRLSAYAPSLSFSLIRPASVLAVPPHFPRSLSLHPLTPLKLRDIFNAWAYSIKHLNSFSIPSIKAENVENVHSFPSHEGCTKQKSAPVLLMQQHS